MKIIKDNIKAKTVKKASSFLQTALFKVEKNIFGEDVLTYIGHNDLVLGGRLLVLQKISNANTDIKPPTLNQELNVANDYDEPEQGVALEDIIMLMGVGLDGADNQIASVKEVDIKSKGFNNLDDMIPFRVVRKGSPEESACDNHYFMKKEENGYCKYYLKTPKIEPSIHCLFEDGTPVTSNTWQSEKMMPIDSYIDYHFVIEGKDLREHFEMKKDLKACRYNSICLYAGVKSEVDGRVEYKNVRCTNKYNTENEPLDNSGKSLNIIYRIYMS